MLDAGRPLHGDHKACPAGEGLMSYASCCHAPNLECHLNEHDPPGYSAQVRGGGVIVHRYVVVGLFLDQRLYVKYTMELSVSNGDHAAGTEPCSE